jgi:hypothetical protein
MGTQVATEAAVTVPTKKPRKTFSFRLDGENGATLRLVLKHRKDGQYSTHAVHSVKEGKKRKHTRGATERHATLEGANVTMEKLTTAALKAGWVRRERKSGFVAVPDAFDAKSLPAAGPAPTKKK